MRDKRSTVPTLDAGLFPCRADMSDGFLGRNWAFEVRRVGNKLAYESHHALHFFGSSCGSVRIS